MGFIKQRGHQSRIAVDPKVSWLRSLEPIQNPSRRWARAVAAKAPGTCTPSLVSSRIISPREAQLPPTWAKGTTRAASVARSLLLLLFGWHSGAYRVCTHSVSRSFLAVSAAVLSALSLQVAPAVAQPAPGAAATNPASLDTMNDLTLAAAVNVCNLAVEQKVPVQAATIASAQSIAYVVTARYGSQIAGSGKLEVGQIVNGSIVQIVARVKEGCYPKIVAADQKFVDSVIADFTKQVKAQEGKK